MALSYKQAKVILMYAKMDMDAVATGDRLWMSYGSINYQLRKIKDETGLNPHKFYDLCRLVGMAQGRMYGSQ